MHAGATAQIAEFVQQILFRRGYQTAEEIEVFLSPNYKSGLHDPFLLTDMEPAVERIITAIRAKEPIAIYGDYDIDGLTATSLMLDFLTGRGANVTGYIPDRFEEGYGINQEALAKLKGQGIKLVVSVDCGITSVKEAAWAKANGLDLVITDHHAVPAELPEAVAVINPKRPGDKYPFKDLAGVGVAFKLVQALQQRLGQPEAGQEKWLLDLVALGTVCDVVTLVGENRVLVHFGLKVLARSRRVGIQQLAAVGSVPLAGISSYHLGFILGPRLNAAGRLEHAAKALELLTTAKTETASSASQYLDRLNQERRNHQAEILAAANQLAERYQNDPVLVLADPGWSHGVVGIVASKLMERWHKPTLILQILGEESKGSGRSVSGFNLVENLRQLEDLFIKVGGHYFAAGFTIKTDRIDELRSRLNQLAAAQELSGEFDPEPDAELADFNLLTLELVRRLEALEPFGNGNPKPMLFLPGAKIVKLKTIGQTNQHLKLVLADAAGNTMTALGFGLVERHPNLTVGQRIDVWFHVVENDFFGSPEVEIVISKIR